MILTELLDNIKSIYPTNTHILSIYHLLFTGYSVSHKGEPPTNGCWDHLKPDMDQCFDPRITHVSLPHP